LIDSLIDGLFRSKNSSAGIRSSVSPPVMDRRQNLHRRSASKRTQLKKEDISDIADVIKPKKQMLHVAQYRGPGRPRGYPTHHRVLRLSHTAGNPGVHSASNSENAMDKVDEPDQVDVVEECHQLSETRSTEELNRSHMTNGDHDYYQTLTSDPAPQRWTANGMIFGSPKHLSLIESESKSMAGDWKKAGFVSSCDAVNGANMSCTRDLFLSVVETDHSYAKRPLPTLEKLFASEQSGSDDVLAQFTILNPGSSCESRLPCHETKPAYYGTEPPCHVANPVCRVTNPVYYEMKLACQETNPVYHKTEPFCHETNPFYHNTNLVYYETRPVCQETKPACVDCATVLPCIQNCTVMLNKLNDSDFEPRPKISLQLRNLEPQSGDKHSTVGENDENNEISSVEGCPASVYGGRSLETASQVMDESRSSSVQPTGLTFGEAAGCGGWDPMRSGDSGLELLASVSSLTADRLEEALQPESQRDLDDVSNWTPESETSRNEPTDISTSASRRRRINVLCVRKRCTPDDVASEDTRLELLDVVRNFVAKGSQGPECRTVQSRLPELEVPHGGATCSRRSEEIACNSLLFMHNSCSSLQNGVVERA